MVVFLIIVKLLNLFFVSEFEIQFIQDANKNRKKWYAKDAAWKKSKSQKVAVTEENAVKPDIGGQLIRHYFLTSEYEFVLR